MKSVKTNNFSPSTGDGQKAYHIGKMRLVKARSHSKRKCKEEQ